MKCDKNRLKIYMENLLSISSPSGYTHKVMEYIKNQLNILNVPYTITNKGALIITLEGKNKEYQRTFSAHVDTLGAMVKEIKSNGKLGISLIGGFMGNSIEGENCTILTINDITYSGTIQTVKPSVHISGNEAYDLKRNIENMEIVLDEKVFSKEDVLQLGIDVGDFVFLEPRTVITDKEFIKSRHLDDKASAAILLYSIEYITKYNIELPYTTNFFISNYEEVGHGAASSIPLATKEFISVDMGAPGLDQNSSEYSVCICAKDSSGPYDYELRKSLINICKEYDINYKIDIYPHYGSDASAALKAGFDIKTALIGPGVFASHAYERTHMDSVIATLNLILKYCETK